MGLFDKVNQMSRSVSESSKNAAETSNLKKKIAYEQERIQEQLQEIGRLFYENPDRAGSLRRHRRQKAPDREHAQRPHLHEGRSGLQQVRCTV